MDDTPEQPAGPGRRPDPVGAARLRGLSHPLRVKILDLLQVHGSLTASRLAELVGESSGSTSYHLRQLAKHEFVREVEGKGTARERWWEPTPGNFVIGPTATDDAGTRTTKSLVNAEFERARQEKIWRLLAQMDQDPRDQPYRTDWEGAMTLATTNTFATPERMRDFIDTVQDLLDTELRKLKEVEHESGALPVQIHFNAFPVIDAVETRPATPPDDGPTEDASA